MAINKKLIHFKTFANFNSLKLSANEANTKYTTGISGTETSGNPDILYQSICFIKDTQQIWTHGLVYNSSADGSGVIIKFNQVFEDGKSVTSNETNLFDKVLEASNANVPVFFHDTNSPILISSYPMSIGNLIVASGARGAATYNFVIVSGSNSVSISTVDYVTSLDDVVTPDLIPTKTSDLTNDSGFITASDNVASATKLQTMRYINGSPFDGTNNVVSYAVCATGASTTAKTVSISRFSLATGSQVRVKFSNANTASAPTLNVGSTGAKRMSYKGSLITNTNFTFNINKIYTFTYDGAYWALEGDWDETPKTSYLSCAFDGEVGDVIWSYDTTNQITLIQNWMNALSGGKVCVLDYDDDIYAVTYALNYRSHETFGSGMAYFSYIFDGYLYEVEYDEVALPVTLTIVNKTKIGGEGGGSSNANVQAVDTGDVLDDVNVDYATKTYVDGLVGDINSTLESMVSGEVYLTPFTVEQFVSGYVELTDEQRNELLDAASNNKIIGMPHSDTTAGYVLVEYNYSRDTEYDYWNLTLNVFYSNVYYRNYIQSNTNLNFIGTKLTTIPLLQVSYTVSVEDGIAEVADASGFPDNAIYWVEGECTELNINLEPSEIGKTVRFFTGENCSLFFGNDVYWANGELPTIEPYTHYELSLVANAEYGFNAVLTPFKLVES